MKTKKVCIGIVAYDGLDGQVSEDYLSLFFVLGRRTDLDYHLMVMYKKEQFRARNVIVAEALKAGCDYILMLDDDHIFGPDMYHVPVQLAKHLELNPEIGVVGALYYQRGDKCWPVVMHEHPDTGMPYFLQHGEISGGMQKVSVTGGGCMMIRASVFDKIDEPWFAPEHEFSTDIQLCRQVRKVGYEVWCDTSLQIGHLQKEKVLITAEQAFGNMKRTGT